MKTRKRSKIPAGWNNMESAERWSPEKGELTYQVVGDESQEVEAEISIPMTFVEDLGKTVRTIPSTYMHKYGIGMCPWTGGTYLRRKMTKLERARYKVNWFTEWVAQVDKYGRLTNQDRSLVVR